MPYIKQKHMKQCLYKFCVLYITGLCWGLCVSSVVMSIFDFFFDAVGSYSCLVALWNFLIGMCFEMFDLAHQLFDEKPIWGSRLIDIFFLGPIEDHVYHP